MKKSKIANAFIAGVLSLAVIGIGYSAYRQKVQADTIVPGYATLHLGLKVTIPDPNAIAIKAVAYPLKGGKKYYFKERDFVFENAGVNNIEWYIRKIPAGNYKVMVTSSSGQFLPQEQSIELINDSINERVRFELYIGEPTAVSSPVVAASPSATTQPTESATLDILASPTPTPVASTSTEPNNEILVPPVPTLPSI